LVQTRGKHKITQHKCTVERRAYLATFEQIEGANDDAAMFHIGSDYGLVHRVSQAGDVAKVVPVTRMSYLGANGRQARITASRFDVDKRTLVRSGLTIMLMVSDQPGRLDANSERFFDSLQFK